VVHISAGTSALVAAVMLGRRHDFGARRSCRTTCRFTLLGAGLLWFGWFGFNAGSALGANALAATAFMTTHTAAAAALTAWMLIDVIRTGRATAVGAATARWSGWSPSRRRPASSPRAPRSPSA
jgi:Amt family ammonium transporter